jgi:hypothetical protein
MVQASTSDGDEDCGTGRVTTLSGMRGGGGISLGRDE